MGNIAKVTVWSVLAPGPSLAKWTRSTFKVDGPVVAVNNAVLAPLPVDFWCCQDIAPKFEPIWSKWPKDDRSLGPVIWCKGHHAHKWADLGFRVWTHPDPEVLFKSTYKIPSEPKVGFVNLTITTAIGRAAGHGAKHIKVYGMDMAGVGYGYGQDLQRNRKPKAWPGRWKGEKPIMDNVLKIMEKMGVKVEVMKA